MFFNHRSNNNSDITDRNFLLAILLIISSLLILLDKYYKPFVQVRTKLNTITYPIYWLADSSIYSILAAKKMFIQNKNLISALERRVVMNEYKIAQTDMLYRENKRLRNLLHYLENNKVDYDTLVADIIHIDTNPLNKKVMLNKGSANRIYVGQAVINIKGLYGQVVSVNKYSSQVMSIVDQQHLTPVEIERTGKYFIAQGNNKNRLDILYVPIDADIVLGDTVITSGIGEVFPRDYFVGKIISINHKDGDDFLQVRVDSKVNYDSNQLLILLFKNIPGNVLLTE